MSQLSRAQTDPSTWFSTHLSGWTNVHLDKLSYQGNFIPGHVSPRQKAPKPMPENCHNGQIWYFAKSLQSDLKLRLYICHKDFWYFKNISLAHGNQNHVYTGNLVPRSLFSFEPRILVKPWRSCQFFYNKSLFMCIFYRKSLISANLFICS